MALVHHWIKSELGVFSLGTSLPGVVSGTFDFVPQATGGVNLDFSLVTPGGPILCYVINYNLGQELVRGFVDGDRADQTQEERGARFLTLLASPRLPGDLVQQ